MEKGEAMGHSTYGTSVLNTGTHYETSRSAPWLPVLSLPDIAHLPPHTSQPPAKSQMNHNKFSIHASTLPSILQNLEWKSLWLSRMNILLLQPDYVFCHMKPKYCGKVWTYAHEDWQIPQIPISGDKSAILASIPRSVGLIFPSVHVRIA